MSALEQVMEPLPMGVRQPPRPPRPPAPPITCGGGGYGSSWDRPLRGPYRRTRRNFLSGVILETRKVMWPTRNDLAHNAVISLVVLGVVDRSNRLAGGGIRRLDPSSHGRRLSAWIADYEVATGPRICRLWIGSKGHYERASRRRLRSVRLSLRVVRAASSEQPLTLTQ
jgi:hypothetical protein